jgi:hypothetical protein
MVPHSIQNNLGALRRRERVLTFVWGLACWLAIVLLLLLLCGLLDWLIDRQRDTPWNVRLGMFLVQAIVAGAAALWFLAWPQVRRLPDALLALWVEAKYPFLQHRLISAVQLNAPGADVEGMSAELITVVTREAEHEANRVGFVRVADHDRLKWSALLLAPVALVVLAPFVLWPQVALTLLARQSLLTDMEIAHSVTLKSISPIVWPIGDTIPLRFRVAGEFDRDMEGVVTVSPTGEPTDTYPLLFIENRTDAETGESYAVFGADVRASASDLLYAARLSDGRTKLPSEMRLVPRPVITQNLAWTRLPAYCGLKPERAGLTVDQRRYEVLQGRGDIIGIPHSAIRVECFVQKPIKEAWIELERSKPQPAGESVANVETIREKKRMTLRPDTESAELKIAEFMFDLDSSMQGYRIMVVDEFGFENIPKPYRSVRLEPEAPPQVTLLRDRMFQNATSDDFDLEGMPVPLGGRIRIPYVCSGPYGLAKAQLLYRILKKHKSGEEPPEEGPWTVLKLFEDGKAEGFNAKTGAFANRKWNEAVPFYAMPSPTPDSVLGRTLGGGRVFLSTNGLVDSKGNAINIKPGDSIEYCIEVFAPEREPLASTPSARSESRISEVVGAEDFTAWLRHVNNEYERLHSLKAKQEGVYKANR